MLAKGATDSESRSQKGWTNTDKIPGPFLQKLKKQNNDFDQFIIQQCKTYSNNF